MKIKPLLLCAALVVPVAANALPDRTQRGSAHGMTYQAASKIVGVTSTATLLGGGDPRYFATRPQDSGVVGLLMDYGADGAFVCSGSLTADRRSIVTAAHCVSDGGAARPDSVTAFFYGGPNPDTRFYNVDPGVVTVGISNIFVNPDYTGEVIDENDIAVLRLGGAAPSFAIGYDLLFGGDLTATDFNIVGLGLRSDVGGNVGANLGPGRRRQGDNRFDYALGDSLFGGFFTDIDPMTGEKFFGTADVEFSYLADFDNGRPANDASCILAGAFGGSGFPYCDLGRGAGEATSAGGDSGGPQFVGGKLAAITSYGLSFGTDFGDIDNALNDTFGEFGGYVPLFIHEAFIRSVVPEPATWAMMIGGFGLVGVSARRNRARVTA